MELLLTAIEHGALAAVLGILWWHERQERLATTEIIMQELQKCLDTQGELLDEEFSPKHK